MIVWINGAFGSGKTQTAYELHRRYAGSFVFDPEQFGYWMRKNRPREMNHCDFQDETLWRSVNFEMLANISSRFGGVLFVPMTITDRVYHEEIIGRLRAAGVDVRHVVLSVSEPVLRKRLRGRFEKPDCWAAKQIPRCLKAFADPFFENPIETDDLKIQEVADRVAEICGLQLKPASHGLKQWFDQIRTQVSVIRWLFKT